MDWYPQQLFTAEQTAAGVFSSFEQRHVFYPQALFMAEQADADVSFL